MRSLRTLVERQAKWQKGRARLAWPEKIRMAELMREAARQLRASTKRKKSAKRDPRPK